MGIVIGCLLSVLPNGAMAADDNSLSNDPANPQITGSVEGPSVVCPINSPVCDALNSLLTQAPNAPYQCTANGAFTVTGNSGNTWTVLGTANGQCNLPTSQLTVTQCLQFSTFFFFGFATPTGWSGDQSCVSHTVAAQSAQFQQSWSFTLSCNDNVREDVHILGISSGSNESSGADWTSDSIDLGAGSC